MSLESILNYSVGDFTVGKLFSALLVLLVCLICIKLLNKMFARIIDRMKFEKSMHTFLKSVIRVLLYVLAAILTASSLGINISAFVALLSVAGLAISLALQEFLSNLASGLMLLISKPFVVGDYIETEEAEGKVLDIRLIHTVISTVDNKDVFLPNSEVTGGKIINYTREEKRRVDLKFSTSYDTALDDAKQALRKAISNTPGILPEPEPYINVSAYRNNAIEYSVMVWSKTEDYWSVQSALLEQVLRCFDEEGIAMYCERMEIQLSPALNEKAQ